MSHKAHQSEGNTGTPRHEEAGRVDYHRGASVAIEGRVPWSIDGLITTRGGRWSEPEQPTIYLAADPGVALAEFGRHLPPSPSAVVGSLWAVPLALVGAADLRDADHGLVIDEGRTHALAGAFRKRGVPGLVVPSIAFPDDRDRCNIVLFADVVGARVSDVIGPPCLLALLGQGPDQ